MRLKREDWTDEDHEIATCILLELSHWDDWISYSFVFKGLKIG